MEENERRREKAIRKLILLVGITGIMLIMSTYAWFSTQKNVTIGNLEGIVKVAEGLEISLDAEHWSQSIDFSKYTNQNEMKKFYGETEHNIIPSEMLPVSTTGKTGSENTVGGNELKMYRGINTEGTILKSIEETSASITTVTDNKYTGYYAIDLFLRNHSKEEGEDVLQLNTDSGVTLKVGGSYATGLQNTVRVGFALYNGTATVPAVTSEQATIIGALTGESAIIKDVAIWEPNAKEHVENIIINNNRITWKAGSGEDVGDKVGYIADQTNGKFTGTERIPTYALNGDAVGKEYTDIYKWDGSQEGIEKQITLQTGREGTAYKITGGIQNLISVNTVGTAIYEKNATGEVTTFKIPKNQICRIRMYVWLEGQDVDCTSYASHGGGVVVNVGLTKGEQVGTETGTGGNEDDGPYIPVGFNHVEGTSLENGYTIQDSTGNQYVWVEVPQTTDVYSTTGLNVTNFTTTEYTAIENDLHTYTSVYRNGTSYTDTWYSEAAQGVTESEYNTLKQKMLKSVYENGGFYVGKYEVGTETARTSSSDSLTTAVIKQNAYPYNYVTNKQAQTLASGMESGEKTSSLMFGVQWDLVLKYLETKGATQAELKSDSTNWGNYYNNFWNITNVSSKYSTNYGSTWTNGAYGERTSSSDVLLSTGASETFSKMGIYDLAGNVSEWTLEYTSFSSDPCADRGGFYGGRGSDNPVSYRSNCATTVSNFYIGFRAALY